MRSRRTPSPRTSNRAAGGKPDGHGARPSTTGRAPPKLSTLKNNITPPYGLNLYVASSVTQIPYFQLLRYTLPYLASLLAVWVIVALVPQLSTVLLTYIGR